LYRALNALVSSKNQSLYELLEKLQTEQNTIEIKLLQSLVVKNQILFEVSRIEEVCEQYESFYGVDFLLTIALLLKLKLD
jgi:hypothetical protein